MATNMTNTGNPFPHATVSGGFVVTGGANQAIGSSVLSPQTANAAMIMKPKRKHDIFFAERRPGCRVPTIDKKLSELKVKVRITTIDNVPYPTITGEDAIEVFGKYNPMYAGRPKKLAEQLLCAMPSSYKGAAMALWHVGLIYWTPMLIGVRGTGKRTSAAGIALLDYWAEHFPKFRPFVNAYVTEKARKAITLDCVDIGLGMRPVSFAEYDEKNKLYRLKADSRELKRLKKEQAANEERMRQENLQREMLQWSMNNQLVGSSGSQRAQDMAIRQQMIDAQQQTYEQMLRHQQSNIGSGLLNAWKRT